MSELEKRMQAEGIVSKLLSTDVVEALDMLSNFEGEENINAGFAEFDKLLSMAADLVRKDEHMMNRLITNALTIYKDEIEEACEDE